MSCALCSLSYLLLFCLQLRSQLTCLVVIPFFATYKVTKKKPSPNNYTNVRPSPTYPGTGWANTEFRTYEFRDSIDDDDLYGVKHGGDNASIVETVDSRKRRGRDGEPPSREQQKQFFVQAMTGWENQLLQNEQKEQHEVVQEKEPIDVSADGKAVISEEREVTTMAS